MTLPFGEGLLKATAQCYMGMACVNSISHPETACGRPARIWLLFGYHVDFHKSYQKHTNPLNCKTSSSDISGYHTDFHEGHSTVRKWQERSMACVNYRGMAWQGNGMYELAFIRMSEVPYDVHFRTGF
jgi:hypothetical protein